LLVYINKFAKIVAKAKVDAFFASRLVAFEYKSREKMSRTVFNCQRVREAKVVFGDNVRIDQSHRDTPS
jgi:hypothetical protein